MKKKFSTYTLFLVVTLVVGGVMIASCMRDELLENMNEARVCAIAPDKELAVDEYEACTRTTLVFTGSAMKFGWLTTDSIGVFNISFSKDESPRINFTYKGPRATSDANSASALFSNSNYSFNTENYWVAYSPLKCVQDETNERIAVASYGEIKLSYTGQKHHTNATPLDISNIPEEEMKYYGSETEASKYLADYDFMISAPTQPDENGMTTFNFKHVGSTLRFFMQFPEGAFGGSGSVAKVKSVSLLSKSGKLVSDVTLAIKDYTAYSTDGSSSFTETSKTEVNKLDLTCTGTDGSGIAVPDKGFLITYMEVYPFSVEANDCILYVVAEVNGVEKTYRSAGLPAKTIVAGKVYQWKPENWDTPIELTATLATWQEIIAKSTNINIEDN